MDKQTRLQSFIAKLQQLDGLSEQKYQALNKSIEQKDNKVGYDCSGKLKVAMFDAKSYDLEFFNKENNNKLTFLPISTTLDSKSAVLAKGCKVVCIFVNDICDKQTLELLANEGVELITLRCAGYNNVDLAACKRLGIDVVRVPAYSPHAVAEHAVALMLMLNRNLHRAYLRNRAGQFVLDGLVGFDMFAKTVGVVGTGNIGECVIDILTGFGCKILAFDKYPNPRLQAQSNVSYTSMQNLEKNSDIITLHVPLNPETHHIIDDGSIQQMKRGVMLINTSRGGLVDTRALIKGLKQEQIGNAGLDVYEEEAGIFFHDISGQVLNDEVFARLLTFGNVLITSHQAFLTKEALSNIAGTTLKNISEYIEGKRGAQLSNVVDVL